MGARVRPGAHVPASELFRFIGGVFLGALLAASGMFLTLHRSPDQPGTGPCADAAEAWAQVDETAKWEYVAVRPGSDVLAPSDDLVMARGRAALLLDDCRAAGQ